MSGAKGKILPFLQVLLLAFSSAKAFISDAPCCILDARFGEFCPTTCGVAEFFQKYQTTVDDSLGTIEKDLRDIQYKNSMTKNKTETIEQSNLIIQKQLPDVYIQRIREVEAEILRFERTTEDRDQELRDLEQLLVSNNEVIVDLKRITQQLQDRCSEPCHDTVQINEITGPDCQEIADKGATTSGLYYIKPVKARQQMLVYCEIDELGRGWTVLQRRLDGSVNFHRNWISYKEGFGYLSPDGSTEFWIGNEKIHLLTTQSNKQFVLQIDLMDWTGQQRHAKYLNFKVGSEEDKYRLLYGMFIGGDAGDAFAGFDFGDDPSDKFYTSHNFMQFSTSDFDNDKYEGNCAEQDQSGWWMNKCHAGNLNGIYHRGGPYTASNNGFDNGIVWATWHSRWYSLKETTMKIMPAGKYNELQRMGQTEQSQLSRGDY
ncbi:fibrinogen gamma chain isoform X2 [Rhincodon typus]|uniref:fibrinogen gamma chain isoform X2 n=1 Tax=Rhincodon typus TaxID=259920 RepID=UPI002030ECEF|nr:fibrinogen gamma chain isoform X2 [Rhincodon typus]